MILWIVVPCLLHLACNLLDCDLQTFALLRYQAAASHVTAWNKPASHQKRHIDQSIPCDWKTTLPSQLTLVLRLVLPTTTWEQTIGTELYLAAPSLAHVEYIAWWQLCLSDLVWNSSTLSFWALMSQMVDNPTFYSCINTFQFHSSRVSNICQSSGWLGEQSSSSFSFSSQQYCLTIICSRFLGTFILDQGNVTWGFSKI